MVYRVFLSSTSKDLATHRDAVERAILRLEGFAPIVMENFGARDATADQIDEAKVRGCDVIVGLVGHCYGSSPNDNPASYTEQEFDLATALGRPRLMLVASDEFRLPANLIEPEEKRQRQVAFRTRVLEERVVALFDDPAVLAGLVTQALANWRAEREQVDQITADLVAAKEAAAKHEARAAELERALQEGQEERKALRAAVQALAERRGSRTRRPRSSRRWLCCLRVGPRRPMRSSPRSWSASRWKARQPCRKRPPRRGISARSPISTTPKRRSRPIARSPISIRTTLRRGYYSVACICERETSPAPNSPLSRRGKPRIELVMSGIKV
jgi:Domain of unknown function (DUF4062)